MYKLQNTYSWISKLYPVEADKPKAKKASREKKMGCYRQHSLNIILWIDSWNSVVKLMNSEQPGNILFPVKGCTAARKSITEYLNINQ
jgi:hypothetical protein